VPVVIGPTRDHRGGGLSVSADQAEGFHGLFLNFAVTIFTHGEHQVRDRVTCARTGFAQQACCRSSYVAVLMLQGLDKRRYRRRPDPLHGLLGNAPALRIAEQVALPCA
jgi:hypothetical protein